MPISSFIARRPGDDQFDDARIAAVGHAITHSNVVSGLVSKHLVVSPVAHGGQFFSVSARCSGDADMIRTPYCIPSIISHDLGRRFHSQFVPEFEALDQEVQDRLYAHDVWRFAFAFDPRRRAIILCVGTSQAVVSSASTGS